MAKFLKKHIDSFNKNGFIKIKNFLSQDKINKILEVANYHLINRIEPIESENKLNNIKTPRRLRDVYSRSNIFKEWMENKEAHQIVEKILKTKIIPEFNHHNSIMTKISLQSISTEWHQDIRYWNFSDNNLISIWLALGEENQLNGALEFIPGSHNMIFKNEQFDKKNYFLDNHKNNIELINSKKSFILSAGDIILFHCKTLHRANKNMTNKNKISFVYTLKSIETKYR